MRNLKPIKLLALSLSLMMLWGCGTSSMEKSENAKEVKSKELVVGMELAYPPFEMTDEKGNPSGISVDIAKALGEYLGRDVRIENMAYNGLIPSLLTGKVDLILSSMTITEERKESISFSNPYSRSYLSLLISKPSPVQNFEDLNARGRKLAVKKGTTGHIYAEKNLQDCEIMVFDKESACVLEVMQGKADAFIYDQMTIYKNWQQNPNTTRAVLKPFQDDPEYWGIGLRKEDEKLKSQINAFLSEFSDEGGFDALAMEYFDEQKKSFDELGIPFFFDIDESPKTKP
ncbi:amino acid ABC transporter substrate-binding protein, PAAT family [Peptoclostridium litorale DSM 5388]|uniref:Cystine-binding periplasmic protein FliY n=1 Tax=Peptoclostridium litorale DSM 5388 TaxID=1121324 RepID=A0A069RLT3_PEPLI|nr:transporter substrate-binding domain-containing protein [Peptoclostridium litorale]KDR95132.1 cystine-binding periplasmic protein FliY [Peptoclostridium litorale DSM 5388]SIN74502.1 amino acid ABC transporter substrate-binding protein, PAAT family [Peptoclostridium litorale DSM 5388]